MTIHVPFQFLLVLLAAAGIFALFFGKPLGALRWLVMGVGGGAAGLLAGGGWATLGLVFFVLGVVAFVNDLFG